MTLVPSVKVANNKSIPPSMESSCWQHSPIVKKMFKIVTRDLMAKTRHSAIASSLNYRIIPTFRIDKIITLITEINIFQLRKQIHI